MLTIFGFLLWIVPVMVVDDTQQNSWQFRVLGGLSFLGMLLATLGVGKWGVLLLVFIAKHADTVNWPWIWGAL